MTAALPSCLHVPTIPSPRVAVAVPSPDKVISNGFPAVSVTFHAPSNSFAAKQATAIMPIANTAATAVLIVFLIVCMCSLLSARVSQFAVYVGCNLPRRQSVSAAQAGNRTVVVHDFHNAPRTKPIIPAKARVVNGWVRRDLSMAFDKLPPTAPT